MRLQKFVTAVIEALGGIVVPLEYGLCHVLIPDEYKEYFLDKTELYLSFDFEVAQENPESEFINFGSYLLENLLELARKKAVSNLRFAEVDRLTMTNALKKINLVMADVPGEKEIIRERPIMGVWAAFNFRVTYIADEKAEEIRQQWVNLLTGEPDDEIQKQQSNIFFGQQPVHNYPVPVELDIVAGFEQAFRLVKQLATQTGEKLLSTKDLRKDVDRIQNYYAELAKENAQKMTRKGITEERKQELAAKLIAIQAECQKQIREINNKYAVKTEVILDHGILYFIPQIEYGIKIVFRKSQQEATVDYNPVLKKFRVRQHDNALIPERFSSLNL